MVQQRKPRGRDRFRRVYWNQLEKAVVAHEAAEIKLERPNITWGACLVEAQDRAISKALLPPNRRSPEEPLRARAKAAFSSLVEQEIQRIVEERNVQSAIQRSELSTIQPAPPPQEAANEGDISLKVFSPLGTKALMEAFGPAVSQAGQIFEHMIEMEFRGRVGKVLNDMGISMGVINPVPEGGVVASAIVPYTKPKVVFAGTEADNLYFQKCAADLEDLFEFVPAKSGGDLLKAVDAAFVVLSNTASNVVKGAIPHVCKKAEILGKESSSMVRTKLKKYGEESYQKYLESLG